jgi:ribosomal protein S18 acetylase RimI-like enzyme
MSFEIKALDLKGNKKDLKSFVSVPWDIYGNEPNWVPPLRISVEELFAKKHPFHQAASVQGFLAVRNGKAIGRILAVDNEAYKKFHEEQVGFFGFYECINDQEVSDALFDKVHTWLKERGLTKVVGPVSPSTNYECGLLVDGFETDPYIMMTHNPKFYPELIEKKGYEKAKDLLAFNIDLSFEMPRAMVRVSDRVEKSNRITYRAVEKSNWDRDVNLLLEIYNSAWEKNWGFVPMSEDEFREIANGMKMIVDENIAYIAFVGDDPAGFIIALPDYHQVFKKIPNGKLLPTGIFKLLFGKKNITRYRVLTLGLKPKYRQLGLASLLIKKTHEMSGAYKEAEMSWVLEDNTNMIKPIERIGGAVHKTYRIYQQDL